jgi:hypothetical protein
MFIIKLWSAIFIWIITTLFVIPSLISCLIFCLFMPIWAEDILFMWKNAIVFLYQIGYEILNDDSVVCLC